MSTEKKTHANELDVEKKAHANELDVLKKGHAQNVAALSIEHARTSKIAAEHQSQREQTIQVLQTEITGLKAEIKFIQSTMRDLEKSNGQH